MRIASLFKLKSKNLKDIKELVGQCFRIENSYGDGTSPWFTYRRVKEVTGLLETGWASCYLFESRSDGSYVVNYHSMIAISALLKQTKMTAEDWDLAHLQFANAITDPWNVE